MNRVAPAAAERLKRETKLRISLLGKIERLQKELVEALDDTWRPTSVARRGPFGEGSEPSDNIDETIGQLLALVESAPFKDGGGQ